jgi:hypothetical protein
MFKIKYLLMACKPIRVGDTIRQVLPLEFDHIFMYRLCDGSSRGSDAQNIASELIHHNDHTISIKRGTG